MRLIDAEILRDRLYKTRNAALADGRNKAYGKGIRDAIEILEAQPTVEPELLKEPEAVEPIAIKQEMFDEFYGAVACCPKCGCMWLMNRENNMHYCPECGQAVKWE